MLSVEANNTNFIAFLLTRSGLAMYRTWGLSLDPIRTLNSRCTTFEVGTLAITTLIKNICSFLNRDDININRSNGTVTIGSSTWYNGHNSYRKPIYIYIYIYIYTRLKIKPNVLELDFRAVKFFFFPRRDLNPHRIECVVR
jgi:hypothetical protein